MLNTTKSLTSAVLGSINILPLLQAITYSTTESAGIIYATIKLTLAGPLQEIDDSLGTKWQPGQALAVADSLGLIASGISVSTKFSENQLELTCLSKLGYFNTLRNPDVAVCLRYLPDRLNSSVVLDLLLNAGLALGEIDVASFLALPGITPKNLYTDNEASLIQIAGAICKDLGFVLWENQAGTIVCIDKKTPGTPSLGNVSKRQLLSFERASAITRPADRLKITGQEFAALQESIIGPGLLIEGADWTYTSFVEELTETGIGIRGYIASFKVDREARKIVQRKRSYAPFDTIAPSYYPAFGPYTAPGISLVSDELTVEQYEKPEFRAGECLPYDEGRLLKRTTYLSKINYQAFAGYYAEKLKLLRRTQPDAKLFDVAGPYAELVSQTQVITETFQYNYPNELKDVARLNISLTSNEPVVAPAGAITTAHSVTVTRNVNTALGELFPLSADNSLGRATGESTLFSQYELVPEEQETRIFHLAKDLQTWTQTVQLLQCGIKAQPENWQRALKQPSVPLASVVRLALGLVNVPIQEPPRGSAPSFARFPAELQPISVPFELTLNLEPSKQYPVTEQMSFGEWCNKQDALITALATAKEKLYEQKGYTISSQYMRNWQPYALLGVLDYVGTRCFALNSHAFVINAEGSASTFSGLNLGYEPGFIVSNVPADDIMHANGTTAKLLGETITLPSPVSATGLYEGVQGQPAGAGWWAFYVQAKAASPKPEISNASQSANIALNSMVFTGNGAIAGEYTGLTFASNAIFAANSPSIAVLPGELVLSNADNLVLSNGDLLKTAS